jgi:hypothetical protein
MISNVELVGDETEPEASLLVDLMIATRLSSLVDVIAGHFLVQAGAGSRGIMLHCINLID